MERIKYFRAGSAVLLSGSLVFGAAACGKASDKAAEKLTEKAIEQSAGGDVDINSEDGSFKVKTDDGSYSYSDDVPEDWPDDVPLPEEFEITGSTSTDSPEGDKSMTITGSTKKSAADVVDFYKDKLSGWEKTGEMNSNDDSGEYRTAVFTKDDRQVSVMATSSEDSTDIVLSYGTGAMVVGG